MRQFRSTQFLTAPVLLYLAWIMAFLFGIAGCLGESSAAVVVKPGEMQKKDQWIRDRLRVPNRPAGTGGRQPGLLVRLRRTARLAELLAAVAAEGPKQKLPKDRTQHTLTWTDAKTGLQVRCVAVEYADFPVVEWTVYFKNTGQANTPILANLQAIDTRYRSAAGWRVPAQIQQGRHAAPRTSMNRSKKSLRRRPNAVRRRRRTGHQSGLPLLQPRDARRRADPGRGLAGPMGRHVLPATPTAACGSWPARNSPTWCCGPARKSARR